MFTKDKNSNPNERHIPSSATLISAGTTLTGDLNSENDLRVDGIIKGNVISSAKVIVGPSGFIEGNIESLHADITGKVLGNITVKELLQLRANSMIEGNISASSLQIDPSATFNGNCQMGASANIVKMGSKNVQAEAK